MWHRYYFIIWNCDKSKTLLYIFCCIQITRRLVKNWFGPVNFQSKISQKTKKQNKFGPVKVFSLFRDLCCMSIVYKSWPETREFITRTVELWNGHVITTEYWTRVHCIHIFWNALLIYSGVSSQCSHTI